MTKTIDRRNFLRQTALFSTALFAAFNSEARADKRSVMTVNGEIDAAAMRQTLIHEHILVDFIGAEEINPPRWDRELVIEKVLPYLQEAKNAGCQTFIDCTPNYLGRDVVLLKQLSEKSGLTIITNTGYYGGSDHKFLPPHVFTETAEQLASRWIREWQDGIDGTAIKPGFMKISVNPAHLTDVSLKLIQAAAVAHKKTGLTIASHTGPAQPAFEQIAVLKSNRIDPSAFIWVHAQNESNIDHHIKAAQEGAWVSLDGLRADNVAEYAHKLVALKAQNALHRVLVSHDAGWYDPGKPDGGEFREYTVLFRKLIPALEQEGFTESDIIQLTVENPANAFAIQVKKLKKRRGE
ncbi:MAG TPA: phosphotriesterase [Chryseosolibacter sp.]|nr:phosphotriesterase [Chryseosolibacter sp.]